MHSWLFPIIDTYPSKAPSQAGGAATSYMSICEIMACVLDASVNN